jgi:hypothetical protein
MTATRVTTRTVPGWIAEATARGRVLGLRVSEDWNIRAWNLTYVDYCDMSGATPKPRQACTFFAVYPETPEGAWDFMRLTLWDGSDTREPVARIENEAKAKPALRAWFDALEASPP